MIVQDEKGTSYWGGFEVKATIKSLLCFNLLFILLEFMPAFQNSILSKAFFLGTLLLGIVAVAMPLGSYNPLAREHAKRGDKSPFFSVQHKFKGK